MAMNNYEEWNRTESNTRTDVFIRFNKQAHLNEFK